MVVTQNRHHINFTNNKRLLISPNVFRGFSRNAVIGNVGRFTMDTAVASFEISALLWNGNSHYTLRSVLGRSSACSNLCGRGGHQHMLASTAACSVVFFLLRIRRRKNYHLWWLSARTLKMDENFPAVKGLLLDIYGVVYDGGADGGQPVKGSIEAIQILRKSKFPFRFISNQSTSTREALCKRIGLVGIDIKPHEITALAPMTAKLLKERNLRPFLLVKDDILEEFKEVNTTNPNCVVMGDAQQNFSYQNLNRAFSVLINSQNPVLVSMGCGRFYKEGDGLRIDVGAYCKGLEYACGIQAEYVGKPNPSYFKQAVEEMNLRADQCAMVGDDVITDIGGAKSAGMSSILVKTGKYRPGDETRTASPPSAVVENLLGAVQRLVKV